MKVQSLIKFSVMVVTSATMVFSPIGARFTVDETPVYAKTVVTKDGLTYEIEDWVTKYPKSSDIDWIPRSNTALKNAQKSCTKKNSSFYYNDYLEDYYQDWYLRSNKREGYREGVESYGGLETGDIERTKDVMNEHNSVLADGLYGTLLADGKEIYTGTDITKYILSATSTANYINNRKTFYYVTGLMDTYDNAIKMKSTVFYFTAQYDGQVKFRQVLPTAYKEWTNPLANIGDLRTAFAIYDVETGKEVSTKNSKASTEISKSYDYYYSGDIEKGKKYCIVVNSEGAFSTSQFEIFTMRTLNSEAKYKQNTWYTRALTNSFNRNDASKIKDCSIKITVTKKSKITLHLKNLVASQEGNSSLMETLSIYSAMNLKKGIIKKLGTFESYKGVEVGTKVGTVSFTVEKGTYYIPITVEPTMYDVAFKYTVTAVK